MNAVRRAVVAAATLVLTVAGVGHVAANDGPAPTTCADLWQPGNTIPADYDGCDLPDGTRHVDPFGHRACFGDLDGPGWLRSPDLAYAARLGGPALDGEALARLNAECLGMSDWLFPDEETTHV